MLVLFACDSTVNPTTSTTPVTLPPETTTTLPDPCPDQFCVIYTIRPDATWSDGVPVTSADFAHTLSLFLDPDGPDPGNPGYELVTGYEVIDDATFLIALSEDFAAWRSLFEIVFPAHVEYDGALPGPTSGPFLVADISDGEVVLERNPLFSGAPDGGDVGSIRLVVADGVREMVAGLGSEFDLINPAPQDWVLDEISDTSGVEYLLSDGPYWEHITFNHSDPLLSQSWMREAIATALDREAILDETVRTINPAAEPLGNTIWMHGSAHYQDHFEVAQSTSTAAALLTSNGCERGSDGIFTCGGRRASFIWATTVGDPHRNSQQDLGIDQLRDAGIEIIPWRLSPTDLFSSPVFFGDSGVWQLISFSWKASADPFLGDSKFQCSGTGPHGMGLLNVSRYCDPDLEELVAAAGGVMDPDERAAVYNQIVDQYLGEFAVIPLYQRPSLLAWTSTLTGPTPNPWTTDMWNVGEWAGQDEVVVAIADDPISLTQPLPTDDAAAMIMNALYLGAFRITPEGEFLPSLVVGAEVLFRGGG